MTEIEIEEIIRQRLDLCEREVTPLIEKSIEEVNDISVSREKFQEYLAALGQFTMSQITEVKEPVLSVYDHYQGRLEGIQMIYKLLSLMKAPKVPFTCDRGDTPYIAYKCGHCGTEIYEEDKFCSECGVALYFEEKGLKGDKVK